MSPYQLSEPIDNVTRSCLSYRWTSGALCACEFGADKDVDVDVLRKRERKREEEDTGFALRA